MMWSTRDEVLATVNYNLRDVEPEDFDGNFTMDIHNWMFPNAKFKGLDGKLMRQLMDVTEGGHLSWVLFPPQGYRL